MRINQLYNELITKYLSPKFEEVGFSKISENSFEKRTGTSNQRVTFGLRENRVGNNGWITCYVSVGFPNVEEIYESFNRSTKKTITTESAELGHIKPGGGYHQWELTESTDLKQLSDDIFFMFQASGLPFLSERANLQALVALWEAGIFENVGREVHFKLPAAYAALQKWDKAIDTVEQFINKMETSASHKAPVSPTDRRHLERLRRYKDYLLSAKPQGVETRE